MTHNPYKKSSKISITYGCVTAMRDPVIPEELTTKRYVDGKIIVGDVKYSVRNTNHNGWLLCDGSSLSRTQYADLFDVIGTSFGPGSNPGSTFNLPNCKGKVLGSIGHDTSKSLSDRDLGDYTGSETHTLTTAEMPSHIHTGITASDGSHTHNINDPGHTHTQTTTNDDFNNSGTNPPGFSADSAGTRTWNNINSSTTGITILSAGSHTHTFTTGSTGTGLAHNNMQPTLFIGNVFMFSGIL
jgi:microcystin-dependent protein